jgi:hypothetical protein
MTAYLIVVLPRVFTVGSKLNVLCLAVTVESAISATHRDLVDTYTGERAHNMSMVCMCVSGKI